MLQDVHTRWGMGGGSRTCSDGTGVYGPFIDDQDMCRHDSGNGPDDMGGMSSDNDRMNATIVYPDP